MLLKFARNCVETGILVKSRHLPDASVTTLLVYAMYMYTVSQS